MFIPTTNFNSRYTKLVDLYYNDTNLVNSTTYGTFRQHNFLSNLATKNQANSYLDPNGLTKYFNYSSQLNHTKSHTKSINTASILNDLNRSITSHTPDLGKLNTLLDAKSFNNPLKYQHVTKEGKIHNPSNSTKSFNSNNHEFEILNFYLNSANNFLNQNIRYAFEDLKSTTQSLLPSERTVRTTDKLTVEKNASVQELNLHNNSVSSIYTDSLSNHVPHNNINNLLSTSTTFPLNHNPVLSSNVGSKNLSYDRTFSKDLNPNLLQSKEESAPNIVFETY